MDLCQAVRIQRFPLLHDIQILAGAHIVPTCGNRQHFTRFRVGLRCGAAGQGQPLKRRSLERIPRQQGQPFTVFHMAGGLAPAKLVIVHAGQVIVNEGIGVKHFHCTGIVQRRLHLAASRLAELQHQHRPHPLASGQQAVPHGVQQFPVRPFRQKTAG